MTYSIKVQKREAGKPAETRLEGLVPGIVYGPDRESTSISIVYKELKKLYDEAGESSLVNVTIEGEEPTIVLIQEVQFDVVKDDIIHVDFRQIKMGEEMNATIEIHLIGESLAVKGLGGTLVEGADSMNIKCLPKDLISHVDVDLSTLKTFDDSIHVGDIKLPEGITTTDNANNIIAKVSAPLTEDQLKTMDEAAAPSIEDVVVEGEKKEGEEGVEGEEKKEGEKPAEEKKKEDKK